MPRSACCLAIFVFRRVLRVNPFGSLRVPREPRVSLALALPDFRARLPVSRSYVFLVKPIRIKRGSCHAAITGSIHSPAGFFPPDTDAGLLSGAHVSAQDDRGAVHDWR